MHIHNNATSYSTLKRRHCEHKFWAQHSQGGIDHLSRAHGLFSVSRGGVRGGARSVRPDMLQPAGIKPMSSVSCNPPMLSHFVTMNNGNTWERNVTPVPLPHWEGVAFDPPPHQCCSHHYSRTYKQKKSSPARTVPCKAVHRSPKHQNIRGGFRLLMLMAFELGSSVLRATLAADWPCISLQQIKLRNLDHIP